MFNLFEDVINKFFMYKKNFQTQKRLQQYNRFHLLNQKNEITMQFTRFQSFQKHKHQIFPLKTQNFGKKATKLVEIRENYGQNDIKRKDLFLPSILPIANINIYRLNIPHSKHIPYVKKHTSIHPHPPKNRIGFLFLRYNKYNNFFKLIQKKHIPPKKVPKQKTFKPSLDLKRKTLQEKYCTRN
eukprot:TRINITY_DN11805_c0_g1_i1.p3 TRINITY_DN11805_c0_g1~~TRINITY_DN11805_c0_g1_i1.p3  ORF type:complete len:184 (-),score=0.83 TRINITY_DN11805_c0_g1_i1:109-660(-)